MELIVEDAEFVTMAAGPAPESVQGLPVRAMLVRDGRIAAVGPAEAVRAAASPGARVARLDGATVIPGLIDAHCHVCDVGYLASAADCSQPSAPDIPAIQARLAGSRRPHAGGLLGDRRRVRRVQAPGGAASDSRRPGSSRAEPPGGRVPHVAARLRAEHGRAAEVGFADYQPDPPGGAFGRDHEGRLDGVVFEGPMFALFERNLRHDLARMGAAQSARMVEMAGQRLAALGLTAACEADMRRDSFGAFAEADENGLLSQRIYGLVVHDQVDWLLGRRACGAVARAGWPPRR